MRMPQMSAMTTRTSEIVIVMATSRVRACPPVVQPLCRSVERGQQTVDRSEPGVEDARHHAKSDAQVTLRAEMDAGNDHRAVFADEPIHERQRIDRIPVAEEGDRARGRRGPMKLARVAAGPVLEHRPALVDQEPRALEELLAPLERDLREHLGDGRWSDGGVILDLERGLDPLRWRDEPADAQARHPVDLGGPAGHHHVLAAPAERRALFARSLGAAIDLIREDPGTVTIGDPHDLGDLALREDLARRIVRLADADDAGPSIHRDAKRIDVDRPATFLA